MDLISELSAVHKKLNKRTNVNLTDLMWHVSQTEPTLPKSVNNCMIQPGEGITYKYLRITTEGLSLNVCPMDKANCIAVSKQLSAHFSSICNITSNFKISRNKTLQSVTPAQLRHIVCWPHLSFRSNAWVFFPLLTSCQLSAFAFPP